MELRSAIYSDLMTLADHFKLNGLEKPRQMILLKEGFTVENGCLTPTFKMMRKRAQDLYKAEIQRAYSMPKLSKKKPAAKL